MRPAESVADSIALLNGLGDEIVELDEELFHPVDNAAIENMRHEIILAAFDIHLYERDILDAQLHHHIGERPDPDILGRLGFIASLRRGGITGH